MVRNWLTLVLWTALLLFLGLGDSHVLQQRVDDGLASFVFRGDLRNPDEIKSAGGFFPRAKTVEGFTTKQLEAGSSLYQHHVGRTPAFTRYVSTTRDPLQAKKFATPFKFSQQEIQRTGYVYRISADPKMVDVVKSLGQENMIKEYVEQEEEAVVGGVPFEQVEGWYDINDFEKDGAKLTTQLKQLKDGDKIESIFKPNPQFNAARYTELRGSGAQPQLAGFTDRGRKLHPASAKEPWSKFKGSKVQDLLADFKKKVGAADQAGDGAAASEEIEAFTEANPLGARDLIGRLDTGEVREGLTSVKIAEASREAEAVEATEELEAAEAAETAEAVTAAEIVETEELAVAGGEISVIGEILGFLAEILA